MADLSVNGKTHQVDVDPNTPLLWVLRDTIGLTGSKYGCGIAQCGACTVIIDDKAVRSCVTPVSSVDGKQVTTIEGIARPEGLHPLQQKFLEGAALQCGICTPGFLVAAKALLDRNPKPTEQQVRHWLAGNLCRCGTFQQVRAAIHAAAASA